MKDIKSLYITAKSSGKRIDIDNYFEAVRDISQNNPNEYLSQIEYIISSNVGLSTLKEFVEKYGISIASYDSIMECLENGVKKSELRGVNSEPYKESIHMMEFFKERYQNCFNMFEAFEDKLQDDYLESYYKRIAVDPPNRRYTNVFSRFGAAAVPDMLIRASRDGILESVLRYVATDSYQSTPSFKEWLNEVAKDFEHDPAIGSFVERVIRPNSLSGIMESVRSRKVSVIRESVLTENPNVVMTYEPHEIRAMEDLISFKEYLMTCYESANDVMRIQKEIYSLYEEFEGLIGEDVADSVIPMLPGSNQKTSVVKEDGLGNTVNKKTGQIPDYIKRNHNLGYGEDNPQNQEPTLDDYKRPSSEKPESDPPQQSQPPEKREVDRDADFSKPMTAAEREQAINNYYYYTYTNSNNTNNNSNNQANSHNQQNDNSTGKTTFNANNNQPKSPSTNPNDKPKPGDPQQQVESVEDFISRSILLTESIDLVLQESDALAIDYAPETNTVPKASFMEKVKALLNKLLDFIINAFDRLFPKNILSFHFLEKKFQKSEGITKLCKKNNNTLKIIEMDVPRSDGINRAVHDMISFLNTGALPKPGMEQYQSIGTGKILIFYGSYSGIDTDQANSKSFGFKIASTEKLSKSSDFSIFGKKMPKSKIDACTYLDDDTLLQAFGVNVKGPTGKDLTLSEIKNLAKNLKAIINVKKVFHPKDKEQYDTLLAITRAIVDLTKMVNQTMNDTYRSAVAVLKSANDPMNSMGESTSLPPWELDIFPTRPESFLESPDSLRDSSGDLYTEEFREEHRQHKKAKTEAVGDADDNKPQSDRPIADFAQDLDRKLTGHHQAIKKNVQDAINVGKVFTKPARRTTQWIGNMVSQWKDLDETQMKERMADPHARSGIFKAVKAAIIGGSLFKAGLLLNPVFAFLAITRGIGKNKKEGRIRNEMIGELKTEMEIIDMKIQHAQSERDIKAAAQLTRFKNELNKKLIRVGTGTPASRKRVAKLI